MLTLSISIKRDEPGWRAANERARRQEVEHLLSKLNIEALKVRASQLKRGVKCSIPLPSYDKATITEVMGGTNYHIPILFADGDSWMCRIHRTNIAAPPPDLLSRILQSEVTTMQFLATTRIPVPRIHDFAFTPDNPVGIPYILMDRIDGRPMYWPELRPFEKTKILQQYADIVLELSRHPFPSIGCLQPSTSSPWQVGPIVFDSHADRDSQGQLSLPGPFTSSTQYRRDLILRHLDQIKTDQTHPKRRLESYLMHLFLLESIPRIVQHEQSPGFYLKHADDKGDHILVDIDMNIVGIIDWEWAQTCPKAEAFCAPVCLVPKVDYHNGDNVLGEDELHFAEILEAKGGHELAEYVRRGRMEHRVSHCVGCEADDRTYFENMFTGLRGALLRPKEGVQNWRAWKRHALERYQDDEALQQILLTESDDDEEEIPELLHLQMSHPFPIR
ncbi:hypothetical protein EUX98_g3635 [Antrodiella citrinella]|uniref:Aminoglycoside phosphotransferase domain-containing protein n=1 Tax=Antrodiella citrinella TaxID=2447956 RepID=A0A4S4MYJ1_9APHY|nr:hypothetical protein EUX98_g3635 [Antrodiella citrinella]